MSADRARSKSWAASKADVSVTGSVVIGPSGRVRGNVSGAELRISGQVQGDLRGSLAVLLEPGARVAGDISAPRVGIAAGALARGHVQTDGEPAARAPAPAPAPAPAARPLTPPARVVPTQAAPPPQSELKPRRPSRRRRRPEWKPRHRCHHRRACRRRSQKSAGPIRRGSLLLRLKRNSRRCARSSLSRGVHHRRSCP